MILRSILIPVLICLWASSIAQTNTHHNYKVTLPVMSDRIDSSLIGFELDVVMKRLQTDSTRLEPFHEPPGILRGVWGNLDDGSELVLFVKRTPGDHYDDIRHQAIIGLVWTGKQGLPLMWGEVIPYFDYGSGR